jgi:hypothetical protein
MRICELLEATSIIDVVVYRGTNQFQTPSGVIFFSTDASFAEDYGHVKQYRMTITHPFDITDPYDFEQISPVIDPYDDAEYEDYTQYKESDGFGSDTWEITEANLRDIKSMGYNGLIIYEGGIKNYAVFSPTQVKEINVKF